MTTNERQNAHKTNKNFNGQLVEKKYNKNTKKTNKATKKGKKRGDEKGNSVTPARGELYTTMSYGFTGERGNWNCTNA